MNIRQAKQIPLEEFLLRLGHRPIRQCSAQLWYASPLRNEQSPSFKVNRRRNLWFDFGLGEGGDIIELIMQLENLGGVSDALARIRAICNSAPSLTLPIAFKPIIDDTPALTLTDIGPVRSPLLLSYLQRRGINPMLAVSFVQEAAYRRGDQRFTALAFANDKGGYELRSPSFKGTLGARDIRTIEGNPERLLIFEGFFDFLSAAMSGPLNGTVIVLNSVAMRERALSEILKRGPRLIEVYPDCDQSGGQLMQFFRDALPDVQMLDRSSLYTGFKDLNEWHISHSGVSSGKERSSELAA